MSSLSKILRSAQVRAWIYFVVTPVYYYYEVIYWIKKRF
jgi:hypothetical protein